MSILSTSSLRQATSRISVTLFIITTYLICCGLNFGCLPLGSTPVEVKGTAFLDEALTGGEVWFYDGDVWLPTEEAASVDDTGAWGPLRPIGVDGGFRVEIRGGTLWGEPFDGALSAYVPYDTLRDLDGSSDAEFEISVTILSTVVERYMRRTGAAYTEAQERVAELFEIPEGTDLFSSELDWTVFAPQEFLSRATETTFDDYVDSLVLDVGTGRRIRMVTPNNGDWFLEQMAFGPWVRATAFRALGGAAAGQAVKFAFGLLLPALGFETFEDTVKNELASIKAGVRELSEKLDALSNKVDGLMANLELTRDEIIDQIVTGLTVNPIDLIENQHANLLALIPATGQQASEQQVKEFVTGVMQHHDIDQALYNLHSRLIGRSGTGAYDSLTNVLVHSISAATDKGAALADCYVILEKFFGDMVGVQTKGAILMENLLSYKEEYEEETGESLLGTKTYHFPSDTYVSTKIQPNIVKQVDVFLTCVERLVVEASDTRTMPAGDYAMVPSEAEQVFVRADFAAHQLAPGNHPAGFTLRIIGDPVVQAKYVKWPAHDPGPGPTTKVLVNGSYTREYAAPIPSNYPEGVNYYLGWSRYNGRTYRFEPVTTMLVTKLHFARYVPRANEYAYSEWLGYPNAVTEAKLSYRDKETGEEVAGPGDDAVFFGSGVVAARNTPIFNFCEADSREEVIETVTMSPPPCSGIGTQGSTGNADWDTRTYLESMTPSLTLRFQMIRGFKRTGIQDMERTGACYFLMENGAGAGVTLSFDAVFHGTGKITGFENARSYPWCGIQFNEYILADDAKLCKAHAQNFEGSHTLHGEDDLDQRTERSGTLTLPAGESRNITFTAWSSINAGGNTGEDRWSYVTYKHTLDSLEIVPQ